jgi:hypothetical protein
MSTQSGRAHHIEVVTFVVDAYTELDGLQQPFLANGLCRLFQFGSGCERQLLKVAAMVELGGFQGFYQTAVLLFLLTLWWCRWPVRG